MVRHCLKDKVALFADVFDKQYCSESHTMPQSCFSEAELTFAFHIGEIQKLLLGLDTLWHWT